MRAKSTGHTKVSFVRTYTLRPPQGSRVFCRHGCTRFAWSTRLIRQVITIIILYYVPCSADGRGIVPPVLYFDFVNGIVLTIAALSRKKHFVIPRQKYYVSGALYDYLVHTPTHDILFILRRANIIKYMLLCIIYPKLKSKICKWHHEMRIRCESIPLTGVLQWYYNIIWSNDTEMNCLFLRKNNVSLKTNSRESRLNHASGKPAKTAAGRIKYNITFWTVMDNKFKILKVNIKRCIELVGTLFFYFYFILPKTIATWRPGWIQICIRL